MPASGSDSLKYASSDDGSDFERFYGSRYSWKWAFSCCVSGMTQQTSVAVGDFDSSANSDSIMQRLLL